MRRGTSVHFWKNYNSLQIGLASACMPRTAAMPSVSVSGTRKTSVASNTKPAQAR